MDDGRIADEMTLEGLAIQLAEFRSEIRAEFGSVRADIKALDGRMTDGFDQTKLEFDQVKLEFDQTRIRFDEIRDLAKLGFESTQILREEVGRRFDDTDRAHAEHKSLIEAAVVDLRRDVTPDRRVFPLR